jgi:hypothetical protein
MPMAMFIENAQFIQNRLSVLLEMREFRFFFARIGRLVELAAILTFGMKSGNAQVRTCTSILENLLRQTQRRFRLGLHLRLLILPSTSSKINPSPTLQGSLLRGSDFPLLLFRNGLRRESLDTSPLMLH